MSGIVFLDTETTGLSPRSEQLFDIAVIEEDGTEHEFHLQPDDVTVRQMHPKALEVNRYHERIAAPDWWWDDPDDVARQLAILLNGKHVVGAVPDFDTRFLDEWYDSLALPTPPWHYHLIDVETLAVGWLHGINAHSMRVHGQPQFGPEVFALPWDSDVLARMCDVDPGPDEDRHTALGDARWVRRWWQRVTS